jgi:hypothetical protein
MYYMMVCSMLSWEIKTCNFSCIKPVWRGRFSVRIAWESPLRFRPTVHTSLALHSSCFWRKNTIYQKRNTSCYPWSLHLICKGQRIEWKSITIQIFKSEPNKFTTKLFSLDPMTSINCPILVKSWCVTWDMKKNIQQAEQAAPRSQQLIYQWKGVV